MSRTGLNDKSRNDFHWKRTNLTPISTQTFPMRRIIAHRPRHLALALLGCLMLSGPLRAANLPDLGDASEATLTRQAERTLGEQTMRSLQASGALLDDPEVNAYLDSLGRRLLQADPSLAGQPFDFFAVESSELNAFALPGADLQWRPDGRARLGLDPAAIIGKLFGDPIKEHLLRPWPVVGAWVVGGIVILAFVANRSRFRVRIDSLQAIPPTTALAIGAAQTVALWPGTSRSFVTILAALALGCSMTVAVEFSFLLGFVTLSAATALELAQNGSEMMDHFGILNPIIGIVVAGVAAFASVRWMITYLERHPLTIFGWYRIALGLGVGVLLVTQTI